MRYFRPHIYSLAAGLMLAAPALAQVETPRPPDTSIAVPAPAAATERSPTLAMLAAQRAAEIGARGHDKDDLAAVQAWYAANSETPLWVSGTTLSDKARAAIVEVARADDWGLKASSFDLPPADATGDAAALADAEARLTLAALKYARHARGGRMDPSQLTEAIDRTANLVSPAKVLADIAAAPAADEVLRKLHPQHPQFERLRQLYLSLRDGKIEPAPVATVPEPLQPARKGRNRKAAAKPQPALAPVLTAERVLFNMEQWRWMPDDLGRLHVAVNIPEFQFTVVKDGRPIHSERVVVGAAATQTPIFSKELDKVVFQPGWGVPPSIKVKQLLPGLLAGRNPVAARGYRMSYRGREVSASSIDWRTVDIRKVSIVQPPGPGNALGQVKFLFPNKHDVYMHDTPSKALFNASSRAFSNGCVRVRNPMRFAEIIFAETAGWAPTRVASLARGRPENEVKVAGATMSIHMTYFTITVGDDGKVNTFRDIYGHERLVLAGIEGRAAQVAKQKQNLSAVRASLVSRAKSRAAVQRARYDDEDGYRDRDRSRRSSRGGGSFWF